MERYQSEIAAAKKSIMIADHLANVTYRVVSDPKLLLTVVERTRDAMRHAAASVCHHQALYKKIPLFSDADMWQSFKPVSKKLKVKEDQIKLALELEAIMKEHEASPVEFRKDGKLVICSESFKMKVIDIKAAKEYLEKAKVFIKEMENATQ